MNFWPSCKASHVLVALQKIGWRVSRQRGSHVILTRPGWPFFVFSYGRSVELGGRILARIAKKTGLTRDDLR